jgi:predicted GIY-YIG superfamily endonuclease
MCFHVYVLPSQSTNRYYIGQTQNIKERRAYHNANYSKALRVVPGLYVLDTIFCYAWKHSREGGV